jgi:aminoacrylate hydrolase
MPAAQLDWGSLNYLEQGEGPPLLLVSGLNGLAQTWQGIVPHLATRFRVITHDHRGLGGSGKWTGDYSVDQIAADVLALMDRLGIERAHLVGHSLGGAAVQAIAADHPGRVAGLVIYASWAGQDAYFARVMTMRREMLEQMGVDAFLRTGPIGIYPPDWIASHDADFTAALPAAMAAFPGIPVMLARIDACLNHDRRATVGHIAAPTLVLGQRDDMSTPAYCSEELAALIAGARLLLLQTGGHNAHLVVPGEVQDALMDFLTDASVAAAMNKE